MQSRQNNKVFTLLVANTKGGCGKTTIATNLASLYAMHGRPVALLDLDPQQSSTWWLKKRSPDLPPVQHIEMNWNTGISSAQLQHCIEQAQDHLIIDLPAALDSNSLNQLVRVSQIILVPVLPSAIDIHAVTRFFQLLMLTPAYRQRPRRVAVIANRTRTNTRVYAQLEKFLSSLKIPFLATLKDSQQYVNAFGEGMGLLEAGLKNPVDEDTWRVMLEWLEIQKRLSQSFFG